MWLLFSGPTCVRGGFATGLLSVLLLCMPLQANAQSPQSSPKALATAQTDPSRLEFRDLAPDARKLIVDEIRIQLQAEDEKRFQALTNEARSWLGIGSGAIGVLAAILALLGWRGLADLRGRLRTDLTEYIRTDERFEKELEAKLEVISKSAALEALEKGRREIKLARLEFLARKVSESDEFSNAELKTMKSLILSVKDDPEITDTEEFTGPAYLVLRSLCQAYLDADIDDLEAENREIFRKVPPICGQLIDAYGEQLLEADNPNENLAKHFQIYADASKQLRMRPLAIPYVLAHLFRSKPEGWAKRIDTHLKEIKYFDDDDKKWLIEAIKSRAERGETSTFRQEREHELVSAFFDEYRDRLESACKAKTS